MKFFLDQDIYAVTELFLKENSHDVVKASDVDMACASDQKILEFARSQERLLLTRDRDFGELVFIKKLGGGVVYLRILPNNVEEVHGQLLEVLSTHGERVLFDSFVVVESNRHRIRRIPS